MWYKSEIPDFDSMMYLDYSSLYESFLAILNSTCVQI